MSGRLGYLDGGIASLAALLRERWWWVEADFERCYRRDLETEIARMPFRQLFARVFGLPPDSATWQGIRPDTVEMVDQWGHALARLMTAKPKEHVPLPASPARPWLEADEKRKPKPKGMSISDFVTKHQEKRRLGEDR